ncbi:MAG: T9SS type A sorting domain-containing protein, partial [Saprospiraceae bacterium]
QIIKVIDDVDPFFTNNCEIFPVIIPDTLCHATVTLPVPVIEDCTGLTNLTAGINIDGTWQSGFGPFYFLPAGDYQVQYTALDKCNNASTCTTTLSVIDPPPVAVCKSELTVTISEPWAPAVQVWASNLDDGSYDNCPSGTIFSFSADTTDVNQLFGCNDTGSQPVQLWVTDLNGSQDYCETTITISLAPNIECEPFDTISGIITTETVEGIANVQVNFSDGYMTTTDTNGNYIYLAQLGSTLSVTPYKNDNHANGVTTFDGVLLVKHVLGVQMLDSPYKMIAADVNKSNSITTFDAVEMRKLILNIITSFPNNTSWRFVPKDFVFPNPLNPFGSGFPETGTTGPPYDFIGIKIGDLNNSAIPAFAGEIHERSYTGESELMLANRFMKKGEAFELPFSPGTGPFSGFQFALQFDPNRLALETIEPGYAGPECFGTAGLAEGLLKTSWFNATAQQRVDGPAFTLHFTAKEEGWLGDALSLDETALPAEVYTPDLEQWSLSLTFEKSSTEDAAFRLLGARPNPFGESTTLEYFLRKESAVSIVISDFSGHVIYSVSKRQTAGRQEWKIGRAGIPAAGLYIYRIKCGDGWGAGKLMVE